MPHTITPVATWHATIDAIADGDAVAQASNDPVTQQLGDNTKYIYDTVGINGSGNLVKTASASNTSPITYTGNGSGAGGVFTGGATGAGVTGTGGGTSGHGVVGTAQNGNSRGGNFTGHGSGDGVRGTGNASGTGIGVRGVGGGSGGAGGVFTATGGNAQGLTATGNGTGEGGVFTGGSGNAVGVRGTGNGTGQGGYFVSNGTGALQSALIADASASASGRAIVAIGGASGRGFYTTGSVIGIEAIGTSRAVQGTISSGSLASTNGAGYFGTSGSGTDAPCLYVSPSAFTDSPGVYTNVVGNGPDLLLEPRGSAPTGPQARKGAIYMNTSGTLYVHNGSTWAALN